MRQWDHSKLWLNKAEQDLYSAECLMEHYPTPYEIICFLCQQTVEKSLKSVLSLYGEEPPRTHDCGSLCSLCVAIDPGFDIWEDICPRFGPFGVTVRYPNELDVEESDARWALKTSREIYEFSAMKLEMLKKELKGSDCGMDQNMQ